MLPIQMTIQWFYNTLWYDIIITIILIPHKYRFRIRIIFIISNKNIQIYIYIQSYDLEMGHHYHFIYQSVSYVILYFRIFREINHLFWGYSHLSSHPEIYTLLLQGQEQDDPPELLRRGHNRSAITRCRFLTRETTHQKGDRLRV